MKRIFLLFLFLAGASGLATAQSVRQLERPRKMTLEPMKPGTETIIMSPRNDNPKSASYKDYSDKSFEELEREMQEREWGSEDTAWKRACEMNSYQSYERYLAIYPNGAHKAEATCLLIDAKVNETLRNAHDDLPNIKLVEADEESPTSTLLIRNNTGYSLTVYCSGSTTKSVVIPRDNFATIVLENGDYKIAASVPPSYIRPFAGKTSFAGGRYEMGFWVVSR